MPDFVAFTGDLPVCLVLGSSTVVQLYLCCHTSRSNYWYFAWLLSSQHILFPSYTGQQRLTQVCTLAQLL
jgi:hypothetical protein